MELTQNSLSITKNQFKDRIKGKTQAWVKNYVLGFEEPLRDRLIAIWAVDEVSGFSSILPLSLPQQKPHVLLDWISRSDEHKKRNPLDWTLDELKVYLDAKWNVMQSNKSNIQWLSTIRGWLDPIEDAAEISKIDAKLKQFSLPKTVTYVSTKDFVNEEE